MALFACAAFLGATLLVSLAQGVASTGGLRALLAGIEPAQRAGLLSTIYIAIGYALLGFISAVIAIASTKGSQP